MRVKVIKSVLLTFGFGSLFMTVAALAYMVFVWSPIQYHYHLAKNIMNNNFLGSPVNSLKHHQHHPAASDLRTAYELDRISNGNDSLQVKFQVRDKSKTTPQFYSAATPKKIVGNVIHLPEITTVDHNDKLSHQRTTSASKQRSLADVDIALDFNNTVPRTNWTRSQKGKNLKPTKIIKFPKNLPKSLEMIKEGNATKYLIYLCDHRANCGGLGDRQRSLTGMYVWSRIINRKFKLVMTTPCNLSDFYVPNKVDWLPKDKELESPSGNNTIFLNSDIDNVTLSKLKVGDFNANFPQRFIYIRTNSDVYSQFWGHAFYDNKLKEWSGLTDLRSRFFWAWHELMKPSAKFKSRLESILGSEFIRRKGLIPRIGNSTTTDKQMYNVGNSSLICAHVRIGKNPSNPRDGAFTAVTGEDIPVLFNFMKQKDTNGDARFFIATDYIYVRNQAQKFFGSQYIEYGALISHIDRQRFDKDACLGFESALLDQTILSLCDVLITSRSGFSLKAAHMRNSTDPVYVIDGGEVRVLEE